jgi:flagellar biosynthesis protein FlhB
LSEEIEEEIVHQPETFPPLVATRRTRVCIWIIVLGLANFLAYTLIYFNLGGDALNEFARIDPATHQVHYYLFSKGTAVEVSRAVWIYSDIHGTIVWMTVGAVLLAMLTLAKDTIVSNMRRSVMRGRTLITIVATVIVLIWVSVTIWMLIHLVTQLCCPRTA